MDAKEQKNSGHWGPEEQLGHRTRGTMNTEDKKNEYRGPEKPWAQRTSGTVGTEDPGNSGHRGPME